MPETGSVGHSQDCCNGGIYYIDSDLEENDEMLYNTSRENEPVSIYLAEASEFQVSNRNKRRRQTFDHRTAAKGKHVESIQSMFPA
jgi:hypothetical protein